MNNPHTTEGGRLRQGEASEIRYLNDKCVPGVALVLAATLAACAPAARPPARLPSAPARPVASPASTATISLQTPPIVARQVAGVTVSGDITGSVSATQTVSILVAPGRVSAEGPWVAVATASVEPRADGGSFSVRVSLGRGRKLVRAALPVGSHDILSRPKSVHIVGPKVVALTFDDGPSLPATRRVLDALKTAGVNATFFESTFLAERHKALVREISKAGNVIGSHGGKHGKLTKLRGAKLAAEIVRGRDGIEHITGIRPKWYRPPFGLTDQVSLAAIRAAGMRSVVWTVESLDYTGISTDQIVANVIGGVDEKDGQIALMHDSGMEQATTPGAVPAIIEALSARGFDFVTLDELDALGVFIPQVMGERAP